MYKIFNYIIKEKRDTYLYILILMNYNDIIKKKIYIAIENINVICFFKTIISYVNRIIIIIIL